MILISTFGILVMALSAMMLSTVQTLPRVSQHAKEKHIEAMDIQQYYSSRVCDAVEVYFSPVRGTMLILCEVQEFEPAMCGGMIYRITEDGGRRFLGSEAYMVTAYPATRPYWDGVIAQDGYQKWAKYVSLHGVVKSQFPGLYW